VALRRLEEGKGVGIYPEGERSWDGALQPFRQGTVRLLLKAGVPVVPCGIDGSYDVWPRWSRRILRFPVRIRFGPPLRWPALDSRQERDAVLGEATQQLRDALEELGAWSRHSRRGASDHRDAPTRVRQEPERGLGEVLGN
jgi:1-acyl-sn-glycerol-3-phosphate acyltransferase